MELISPLLRNDFREFCVCHLVLRQIEDVFSMAGVPQGTIDTNRPISGARRALVEQYYASLDWTSALDSQKFLKVIGYTLAQSYLSEENKSYLRDACKKSGFIIDGYNIYLSGKGVEAKVKNLIFAADGPKPEIILADSVSNDIQILKNAEYCLVYSKPIFEHGLLWKELVEWYSEITEESQANKLEVERRLYIRLNKSLASEPEKLFFRTYFEQFREPLGERFPALIPQVYLHYDPFTISQLAEGKRLFRQRMDFLLLFSNRTRIVMEIDGKQHYAEQDTASPRLYAEMVTEDRRLKLAGYEVYHFGGYELQGEAGKMVVKNFFEALFAKYLNGQ